MKEAKRNRIVKKYARKLRRKIRMAERLAASSGRAHYIHFNGREYTCYNRTGLKSLIKNKLVPKNKTLEMLIHDATYKTSKQYINNKITFLERENLKLKKSLKKQ